jgi:hypothetical protein
MNAATVRLPPPARVLAGTFIVGLLLAGVLLAMPAPAAAALPTIISTAWAPTTSEVLLEAKIDPGGLETTYEIQVECPDHVLCQRTEGKLPAIVENLTVILALREPQYGSTYWFTVTAHNAEGEASKSSEAALPSTPPEIPPGACPFGGCGPPQQPYTPPELPWANQSGNEAAARTVAEQRAKEHEEQQAKEAAAQRAAEAEALKRRQEEQAEQAFREREEREDKEAEHPACRVPVLKGDTLTAARRALAKAHCRLGAVHQPAHHHGTLRVSAQGAPAGEQLAHGARVALWVGAKESGAKRASRRGNGRQ